MVPRYKLNQISFKPRKHLLCIGVRHDRKPVEIQIRKQHNLIFRQLFFKYFGSYPILHMTESCWIFPAYSVSYLNSLMKYKWNQVSWTDLQQLP